MVPNDGLKEKIDGLKTNTNKEKAKTKMKTVISMVSHMICNQQKKNVAFREHLNPNQGMESPRRSAIDSHRLGNGKWQMAPVVNSSEINMFEEDLYQNIDPKVKKIIWQYGRLVAFCHVGSIFGEIALVNNNPRTATVIAEEDCHLMVFSKESFEYVRATYTQEFIERKRFLREVFPSIRHITDADTLNRMAQVFSPRSFKLHQLLTLEGNEGRNVLIVQEGICEVYRKLAMDIANKAELEEINLDIPITTAVPGSIIGEEIIFGYETYFYTVKAKTSIVRVLELSRNRVKELILNDIYKDLKDYFQTSKYA